MLLIKTRFNNKLEDYFIFYGITSSKKDELKSNSIFWELYDQIQQDNTVEY